MDSTHSALPSPEMIAAASDEAVEQVIVDAVTALLAVNTRQSYETATALPRGFRAVYLTHVLEEEVTNGGFLQYFYNPSGQFAEETLDSLESIGADSHAAILEGAMERLLSEMDTLAPLWKPRTLEGFFASCKVSTIPEFDKRWYALESLARTKVAYIRAHVEDFRQGGVQI